MFFRQSSNQTVAKLGTETAAGCNRGPAAFCCVVRFAQSSAALTILGVVFFLPATHADPGFGSYWNRGKAEITSYDLEQARYGEMHRGSAVLIFVTEPFNPETQVKADNPTEDSVQVLKLNMTKKFNTGIYPYSMMLSVFSPVDLAKHPHTFKASVSSQEWCGHTWTQLNWRDDAYQAEQRSYFESEGDRHFTAGNAMLEDEVWTRIRLAPDQLATGETRMIPGGLNARLRHRMQQPEKVIATLEDRDDLKIYTLEYPAMNRTLRITFEAAFPYRIQGWEETGESGWGADAKRLTTRATRKREMLVDYWNHHDNIDRPMRGDLGLPVD